jgi:hypothetical protein
MTYRVEPRTDDKGRVLSLPTPRNREELIILMAACKTGIPGILEMRMDEYLADAVLSILAKAGVFLVTEPMDQQQATAAMEAAKSQKTMASGLNAAYSAAVRNSPLIRKSP